MYLSEQEEKEYLSIIIQKLESAYMNIDLQIDNTSKDIIDSKKYIWDNIDQLDLAEKAANRMAIYDAIDFGEKAKIKKGRIEKMIQSPYFGRIDFVSLDLEVEKEYYIGIHSFSDIAGKENLIYDWRAPISSMYYDFEVGEAYYHAPIGLIQGEITRKRQYKIKNCIMEYMLESALSISDDVLQKELSSTTDMKMKNIVATIQREQNAIIRDENTKLLIIQGCAGSGKSSIAMHRIAFLLYRYQEEITADNILIITPNKIFTDYISNVLPELGEENIPEIEFDALAMELLEHKISFQTYAEQLEELFTVKREETIQRIKVKSSISFLYELKQYIQMIESEYFVPRDIECNGTIITKEEIRNRYDLANNLPILKRITMISRDITNKLKSISLENDMKWSSKYGNKIKKQLLNMLQFKTTHQLYQNFYEYFNCTHLYRDKKVMEYSDVFPYIYIKLHFEGISSNYNYVRHLLIDEMQDYTPVQYAIIKEIFKCKMTIMGDRNQNINPYSSSSSEKILSVFPNAACMDLTRSYRSTFEITEFSRRISPSINILPVERHGDDVTVHSCRLEQEEINIIRNALNAFKTSKYQSFAILCKSQLQAEILYNKLHELSEEIELLGFSDSKFKDGVILTSIQMAKGLEFDQVLIPQVQNENYHSEMERSLLYVACTRAMHKLEISYTGKPSLFI